MARSERSVEKEAYWRRMLDEQRQSGLHVRAFCRAKSILEPSFYAWRRALAAREVERTAAGDGQGRLIPVDVIRPCYEPTTPSSDIAHRLEVVTPGGFTLRFAADASSDTIARVLDIVAQHAAKRISVC